MYSTVAEINTGRQVSQLITYRDDWTRHTKPIHKKSLVIWSALWLFSQQLIYISTILKNTLPILQLSTGYCKKVLLLMLPLVSVTAGMRRRNLWTPLYTLTPPPPPSLLVTHPIPDCVFEEVIPRVESAVQKQDVLSGSTALYLPQLFSKTHSYFSFVDFYTSYEPFVEQTNRLWDHYQSHQHQKQAHKTPIAHVSTWHLGEIPSRIAANTGSKILWVGRREFPGAPISPI